MWWGRGSQRLLKGEEIPNFRKETGCSYLTRIGTVSVSQGPLVREKVRPRKSVRDLTRGIRNGGKSKSPRSLGKSDQVKGGVFLFLIS